MLPVIVPLKDSVSFQVKVCLCYPCGKLTEKDTVLIEKHLPVKKLDSQRAEQIRVWSFLRAWLKITRHY